MSLLRVSPGHVVCVWVSLNFRPIFGKMCFIFDQNLFFSPKSPSKNWSCFFFTALRTVVKNCSYTISALDGNSAKTQGRTSWLTRAWIVYIWENIWEQSLKVPSPNHWLEYICSIISSKYKHSVNIPYPTIKNQISFACSSHLILMR